MEGNQKDEPMTHCIFCAQPYSKEHPPVTLPCGHNVGKSCAEQRRRKNGMLQCPIDESEQRISNLQVNVDYLDFVQILCEEQVELPSKRKPGPSVSVQCDRLKSKAAYSEKLNTLRASLRQTEQLTGYYAALYIERVAALCQSAQSRQTS